MIKKIVVVQNKDGKLNYYLNISRGFLIFFNFI